MYRKKYVTRRRFVRRRPRRPTGGLLSRFSRMRVGDVARKAYQGVKYLRSLVNAEKHKYDTNLSQVVTTSPAFIQLNDIAVGDTDSTRTGNSILMHNMSYKGIAYINPNNAVGWLRMVVVLDTQQVGDTTPSFTTIFESASVNSQLNSDTVGRFTILKDHVFSLSSGGRQNISIKGVIPLKTHARFNGTGNGDIQKNGLYVYFVSADATNGPTIDMNFRLNYYDN